MQTIITPDQSRAARRELGLSQADVATAVSINRQYVSEFETGYSNRITTAQLRKLRSFYESKIEEAKASGEEITLTFGDSATSQSTPVKVEPFVGKRFTFQVADNVSDETVETTLKTIGENDKRLVDLLTSIATNEDGLFGPGEYTDETLEAFRESFALLAGNYLLIRAIGGWPEVGLAASGISIASDAVLAKLIDQCRASFESAGLAINGQTEATDEDEEVEV